MTRGRQATNTSQPTLADALRDACAPFTRDELEMAREPWPHVFADNDSRGLLPRGEVSIVAAPGREGKTFSIVGLAVALALELEVGGMRPAHPGRTVIYSAEDDRQQLARKLLAATANLGRDDAKKVWGSIVVPNLEIREVEWLQTIIAPNDARQPAPRVGVVAAITDALRDTQIDLIAFETASTLNDCDETNQSFRMLVRVLRKIARELGCAVLLTHHTSQAAMSNLANLNINVGDIRGGTALVSNSRQNAMLVNLGGEDDPFPDDDARTKLRRAVLPHVQERAAAWITLDSSKSATPPPIFFRWTQTEFGPALAVAPVARRYAGMSWRQMQRMVAADTHDGVKRHQRRGTAAADVDEAYWQDVE